MPSMMGGLMGEYTGFLNNPSSRINNYSGRVIISGTVPQGTQWSGCQSQFRSTSALMCGTWVCWSAVCILQIYYRGPPPRFLYRLRRPQLFFRTFFSCFFRTPSWKPFGPPKTSVVANLDPKMTPKWSPKSKKNPTS